MPSNKNNQNESIYNLVPRPQVIPPKPPRYESKYKETAKEELKSVKDDHRTMGYAKEPVPMPNEFLKAHQKEFVPPKPTGVKPHQNEPKKPSIPDQIKDKPLLGLKTNKNFISQNAVDTIMAVPRKPERNVVDTRKGDKFPIDPSGLAPVYVKKKELGKVPGYILHRKDEAANAKAEYEAYMNEYFKKGALRAMTDDEREAILTALKQNWDDLHHKYQALSVMIDTIPKKMKKEGLENDMKMLEKDIDLLQRHQLIYVAD